jgi:uncharacterized membrane protein
MQQTPGQVDSGRPRVAGRTRDLVVALDRAIFAFSNHWLVAFNVFIAVYLGVPFLAPVFMKAGWVTPARVIYTIYSPMCHQLGYRSWYLFGERSNYSRYVFQAYTGIDPDTYDGFLASRAFEGNAQMGYKVALCERDVAIYGMMLLAGLIFSAPGLRQRLKPLRWWLWILIGLVPIGLDGFWQLFTNYPYITLLTFMKAFPYHESTAFLRSLTGALFGLANVWLAYPYFDQSMREAHDELKVKLARVDSRAAAAKFRAGA